MSRPHLLLLDPDAATREGLAAELRQAGLELTACGAVEELPSPPAGALLVVDSGSFPLATLERLRSPERPLFVLLRTPGPERWQALLGAGATRILTANTPLPAQLEQLLAPVTSEPEPTEMEGAFTPEGLAAAIDHVGGRSAIITCTTDGGDIGTLWLRDGRIVDVQLAALAPGRALARLFTWKSGRCHMLMGPHDHEEAIALDAHLGGEEALRRAEVWQRLVTALGGISAVFRVDYVALARQLADVPDDANVMLRLVDGTRPLAAIIDQVPFDELHTLAVALRLRVDGVLVPATAFPERTVAEVSVAESDPEAGPPLITVQAIDEALAWVAAPSMIPWTPTKGPIHVVQFSSRRGSRKDRLQQEAMERRGLAAQRDERPVLLTDEVLAPGALPVVSRSQDRTEILVSAARSPVSERPDPSSRGMMLALTLAAIVLSLVVVVQSLRRQESPAVVVAEPPPVVIQTFPPAAPPPAPIPAPKEEVAAVPLPVVTAKAPAMKVVPPPVAPKSAALPPGSYEALLKAGSQLNAQGLAAKAVPLLEQAVAKKKTAPALLELGKAYYASDKLDPAIKSLQQATQLDGKLATAFMYLGMALQDAHRPADAKAAYKQFLELEPASSPRHAEIASVLNHL